MKLSLSAVHERQLEQRNRYLALWYIFNREFYKHSARFQVGTSSAMDVVKAVETYVTKLVSSSSAMKVLLLDSHTTPIVSLSSTQSMLLSHQIYLTDRIDNNKRDRMPHMKCVCFLQSSEHSLVALETELREPKYGEYYLCQSILATF